ncbi:transmembrane protein 131-like isoform X2 [Hydractinia symbiolongicarpus]|uniref:transmembrane protein 131-like isoform X2 n=1 Tax=Hydractinia symbiolongicarpus TaxID=13093 RepID=UPI00254D3B77|nr:transmembrane protein 131-like isoform X2 [Hydractinia symbiolongicarpus]
MAYPVNMCIVTLFIGLKIQVFLIITLCLLVPDIYSRCGCHRVPGQGFLAHTKQGAGSHNFEPLPQAIQAGSDGSSGKYSVPNFRVLLFQPTFLDFQEQPVGMPHVQSIVLLNPSDQNDIEILAVNALPPFHASRFSKKMLSPLTNMTIDLVFLATMIGNVEHTVYIHTSRGNFPYQVFGVGMANPYRLRAFVSARIPLNGTFSPYINMYNPYSEAIQITEMYSSGSDLHLDLLGNNNDSIGKLWEIPPYETKAVMKATYFSKEEGLAIRFIRIVIGPPAPPTDVLILPFEMLVSTKKGLYTNVDMLDFGTLRTMDEPKSLNLNALNNGNKSLQLLSIQVVPPNKAVSVQFTPFSLKTSKKYSKIATITYTALQASHKRQNSGKIIVYTSDDKKRLEVPYQANVLQGTLAYSVGKTSFFAGDSPMTQVLTITNTFNTTLVIYNATLPVEAQHIFSILNFSKAIMVPPGKLISPLSLTFQANESELSFSTVLRLYTNASIFTIPVHCYNGKLKYIVDSLNDDVLDYGTVGTQENRSLTFRIINNNPVEVSIKEYGTQFEFARLRLLHVKNLKKTKHSKRSKWVNEKSNNTTASKGSTSKKKTGKEGDELILKPSDVVTFTVDIEAPQKEGTYHGEIIMKTIFEAIRIPIYLKAVEGSLVSKPRRIKIEKAFPGRTENYALTIESTFPYPITLQNLSVYPEDPRFHFIRPDYLPELPSKEKVHIGWVKFDPFFGEESQCYLCVCEIDPACDHWHQSLSLPADTWEHDFNLLDKLRRKWDIVNSKQESSFNASIIIDSSVIKSYTIPVQASLAWPSLVEQSIRFPPTHVGNFSFENMVITNPSDHPLVVQIVPLLSYPQPDGGLDLLSDRLIMDSFSLDLNGHSQFTLPDIKDGWQDHQQVSSALNVYPSVNSLSMILQPREKKSVQVGFLPNDESPKTSIMVVRNNLTVLDLVVVHGQGARTHFNMDGNAPGSKSSVLFFEIKAIHLKDCNKSTPKARVYPSFTVKRSFTATNVGQLPVHVVSMSINNYECEGFGFRILNCESFILMPNDTRKIDVTFIPDFTTSRVTRTLRLLTTMEQSLDFILLATLPHHLLPLCANALPRPFWEPYMHVAAAVVMSTVFIFIIFFAYFDAQKYVVKCTFTAGSVTSSPYFGGYKSDGHLLDLKNFGFKIVADKNDKFSDPKDHQRLAKSHSSPPVRTQIIHSANKPNESNYSSSGLRDRGRSSSDSSSASSRKNSNTVQPSHHSFIPEEKPEPRSTVKEHETQTKRSKRKPHDASRKPQRVTTYEEPQEPVIEPVTEVLCDPYDRSQMEKLRQERIQKQKSKFEYNDDSEKQKSRKKSKTSQKSKEQHRVLQKENSCGSSNAEDDERVDEKPGFTTVKLKGKKKSESPSMYPSYNGHLDKLDDFSLTEPLIQSKDMRPKSKPEYKTKAPPRKKIATYHEKERLMMDTPTSPHAIAAAIFDAALMKNKKKDISPSTSNRGSPQHRSYEEPSDAKKTKKDNNIGWSFFKKFGLGLGRDEKDEEPTTSSASSMFYYDNLTSLRASRQNSDNEKRQRYAPGFNGKESSVVSSTLSPDSAEFVPKNLRMNKAVGSNLKKDNSWATVDDSALEHLRPPPGLTRQKTRDIWDFDDIVKPSNETTADDGWQKSSLFDFKNGGSYSSLLGGSRGSKNLFGGFDLLGSRGSREDLWKSSDNEFSNIDKDLWGNGTSIRSSIWDAPDSLITTTSSAGNTPRSRLGLGLDLKPVSEVGLSDAESPLDPFSIWASSSPYEGWNQDIKED